MAAALRPGREPLGDAAPPRPPLRLELLANLAGGGWGAVVQLVCIPLYVHRIGIEAYGLVAFASTLYLSLKALDFGASHTMSREMARAEAEGAGAARRFALRLERGYLALGLVLGALVLLLAPAIATGWISPGALPREDVIRAVRLIALLVAVQWPLTLYQGGLMGRRRAVAMNGVAVAMTTLSGGGALLLLYLVRPSLDLLLGWFVTVGLLHTLAAAVLHHRALPADDGGTRDRAADVARMRAAAGTGALALTTLLVLQADKLFASRVLPLADYGWYMVGAAIASGVAVLNAPVFNTVYPRLAAMAAAGDRDGLRRTYAAATQLLGALVFPAAATLALHAPEIVRQWTRRPEAAASAGTVTAALVVGTALAGVLQLTQALQMASGRTRAGTLLNVALVLALALLAPVAARDGAPTVAAIWAALLALHLVIGTWLVHSRLIGDGARWLARDLLGPLAAVGLGALAVRTLLPAGGSLATTVAMALGTWVLLVALAMLAAPEVRLGARRLLGTGARA